MHRLLALLHTHGPRHMVYWSHVVSRYCPQYPGVESHVMDIFVLKVLVDDLRRQLLGATVSKVFQMSPDSILLRLWRGRRYGCGCGGSRTCRPPWHIAAYNRR